MTDTQPLGLLPEADAIYHGFKSAFSHFAGFIYHEAGTPEGEAVMTMAKGFAAAHGVDPALFDQGGKVVTAAMEFARVIAQQNAAASVKSTTLTITTAPTVT